MDHPDQAKNLQAILDQIDSAAHDRDRVSLNAIMDTVGRRSFGPILVVAGLVILAPLIGDIPGVPTIMAMLILVIAVQVLLRRDHLWLPRWMLDRSVHSDKLLKATGWLRSPARFIDRLTRPRLQYLTREAGIQATAVLCIIIAIALPPMELVPFSANAGGLALTTLGLALIASDGLLVLGALVVSSGGLGMLLYHLLL